MLIVTLATTLRPTLALTPTVTVTLSLTSHPHPYQSTSQVTAPSRFEKFACPIEATIDETESTGAGIETTRLRTSSLG